MQPDEPPGGLGRPESNHRSGRVSSALRPFIQFGRSCHGFLSSKIQFLKEMDVVHLNFIYPFTELNPVSTSVNSKCQNCPRAWWVVMSTARMREYWSLVWFGWDLGADLGALDLQSWLSSKKAKKKNYEPVSLGCLLINPVSWSLLPEHEEAERNV